MNPEPLKQDESVLRLLDEARQIASKNSWYIGVQHVFIAIIEQAMDESNGGDFNYFLEENGLTSEAFRRRLEKLRLATYSPPTVDFDVAGDEAAVRSCYPDYEIRIVNPEDSMRAPLRGLATRLPDPFWKELATTASSTSP